MNEINDEQVELVDEPDEPMEEPNESNEPIIIDIVNQPANEQVIEPDMEKCPNCEVFTCHQPAAFKRHVKSIINCDSCEKKFCGKRAKEQLKSHQREHSYRPKTPYFCTVCKKAFKTPSYIKNHIKNTKCGKTTSNNE